MPLNVSREEVFTSYEYEVKKFRRLGKEWRLTDSDIDEIIHNSFHFLQEQHIKTENVKSSSDSISTKSLRSSYSFQFIIKIIVVALLALTVACLLITYHKPTYNLVVRNVQELIYPIMKCLRRITLPVVKALPSITGNSTHKLYVLLQVTVHTVYIKVQLIELFSFFKYHVLITFQMIHIRSLPCAAVSSVFIDMNLAARLL